MIILFVVLKLYNVGVINLELKEKSVEKLSQSLKAPTASPTPQYPIPWRFQIEEDGFFFPDTSNKEKFITYERVKGPLTKQITMFENAAIFAYLLGRTLLVPKLKVQIPDDYVTLYQNKEVANSNNTATLNFDNNETFIHKLYFRNNTSTSLLNDISMSEIIDFDLLSSQVKLKPLEENFASTLTHYNVCHDPHLGFWVDYIPSVENIQIWRVLKQQYFYPLKLKLNLGKDEHGNKDEHVCPGTKEYLNRWGPPLRTKPLYRGIITELVKRTEDLIFFQGDTLDTSQIRFFDQQRTKKAQEILLFYIRFSRTLTQKVKHFVNLLDTGFSAILAEGDIKADGVSLFISNEADRLNLMNISNNIFIVCNSSYRQVFNILRDKGFTLIFADEFINKNHDESILYPTDYARIISLLLCAYAKQFIGLPGTHDLYFVEHLRLQDATMIDGLVTNKINVRWAKHTIRDQADNLKVLIKDKMQPVSTLSTNFPIKFIERKALKSNSSVKSKISMVSVSKKSAVTMKKKDKLTSMACTFCNYVRYVTGLQGCPTMRQVC